MGLGRLPNMIFLLVARAICGLLRACVRPLFASCGSGVRFNPFDRFSYGTIHIGDDVYIASGACFSVTKGLNIGSKVLFGPYVTIMGGDHNTSTVGEYMFDIDTKEPGNDKPVTIEDDVWVGARVVILKGVTIHRGSIIGAGAVVTRDIPPYGIAAGVPAKVIKYRWPLAKVIEHEEKLYAKEKRFNKDELSHIRP